MHMCMQVQIRPWKITDSDFIMDHSQPIDPRKTIFIGGVPRPLKAHELADIFNSRYGNVCYAGIDVDPELKYPKGLPFTMHGVMCVLIVSRGFELCAV